MSHSAPPSSPPPDDWDKASSSHQSARTSSINAPQSPQSFLDLSIARFEHGGRSSHPLFLLSAMCMLIGCFVVQSALSNRGTNGVFGLALTVVGYELLLAGVAWVLLKLDFWRNLMQLLALAVLFFADPTFTYFRLIIVDVGTGIAVTLGVLFLTVGKLWVLRSASPELAGALGWKALGLAGAGFVLNLILPFWPALYSAKYAGWTAPGLYLSWWLFAAAVALALPRLIGFMRDDPVQGAVQPVNLAAAVALTPAQNRLALQRDRVATRWLQFVVLLPLATLLLRLVFLHWLYIQDLRLCFLATLALACAVRADWFFRERAPYRAAALRLGLLALAVLLSQTRIEHLDYPAPIFTPWRLVLMVSALMLTWETGRLRSWFHGSLAGVAAVMSLLTSGPADLTPLFRGAKRWSFEYLIPSTPMMWGVVAICAAFALLIAGLGWSLLQARKEQGRNAAEA